MCFSTGSKTGHKSGKWVIWTRLEVEGELNGVVWRWIWSHACGPESKVHAGHGSGGHAGHGSGGHAGRALG